MVRRIPRQLQPEVSFHRSRNVRWPRRINAPPAIFILVPQNPVCRLLKPLLIPRPQQHVQQNVIRLEGRIRFQFAAPVPILMPLREQILLRRRNCSAYTKAQFFNLAETKLWVRT